MCASMPLAHCRKLPAKQIRGHLASLSRGLHALTHCFSVISKDVKPCLETLSNDADLDVKFFARTALTAC